MSLQEKIDEHNRRVKAAFERAEAGETICLSDLEEEMPFYKTPKGQRTWWQCPNPICGCAFYTDNRQPCADGKKLEAWQRGVDGWA